MNKSLRGSWHPPELKDHTTFQTPPPDAFQDIAGFHPILKKQISSAESQKGAIAIDFVQQ